MRNCGNCKFKDYNINTDPCYDCDQEDAWLPPEVDQTRVMALEEQVGKIIKDIAELREMYDQISWDEAISLGKGIRDAELGNFVKMKGAELEDERPTKTIPYLNDSKKWNELHNDNPSCNKCHLYGECDHQGAYKTKDVWCYEESTPSEHMWSHLTDVSHCCICNKFAHDVGYKSECQPKDVQVFDPETSTDFKMPEGKPVKGYCFQKVYCGECMGYDLCESKSKVGIYKEEAHCTTCKYIDVDDEDEPCFSCDKEYSRWKPT